MTVVADVSRLALRFDDCRLSDAARPAKALAYFRRGAARRRALLTGRIFIKFMLAFVLAPAVAPRGLQMTIARLWRTRVDLSRAEEYERFAQSVSLDMFRSQPGFVAVTMYRRAEECAVLTLWESEAAAAALDCAERYLRTVARSMLQASFVRRRALRSERYMYFTPRSAKTNSIEVLLCNLQSQEPEACLLRDIVGIAASQLPRAKLIKNVPHVLALSVGLVVNIANLSTFGT
jgi:heme-degrading monooxygenase HmoA